MSVKKVEKKKEPENKKQALPQKTEAKKEEATKIVAKESNE